MEEEEEEEEDGEGRGGERRQLRMHRKSQGYSRRQVVEYVVYEMWLSMFRPLAFTLRERWTTLAILAEDWWV